MSCIDLIITDQPNLYVDFGVYSSPDDHCQHQIIHGKRKANRQQPRSARLRPIQEIPIPIKLLISPLLEMTNQICKKYSLGNYQDKKTSDDTCDIFQNP